MIAMTMKQEDLLLYDCRQAPSAFRIRMFVAEKGQELPTRQVDLLSGEHLRDDYLAINPSGLVPALQIPCSPDPITENDGIAAYFEALWPERPLLGRTALEKGRIAEWNSRIVLYGLLPLATWFRNHHPSFEGRAVPGPTGYGQIPDLVGRSRRQLSEFRQTLETHISDHDHVSGAEFAWADMTAITLIDLATMLELDEWTGSAPINVYADKVRSRPAYEVARPFWR